MAVAPHVAPPAPSQPSSSLLANLRIELMRYAPFAQMQAAHVERFVAVAEQVYYAPGETVLSPADGAPKQLFCIRQGHITGRVGSDETASGFEYDAGDLFPVGAVMGARPVAATYRAHEDVSCLLLPVQEVRALAAQSAPFADFLGQRALKYLELSRRAVQATYSSQALDEQSLETPLGQLSLKTPVAVPPHTPLSEALATMHERHIGSVLVVDTAGAALGILTRHDILGRVALAQVAMSAPISQVMTAPIHTLSAQDTAQDAALLMSRHAIRHVPVTRDGRVVGLVSERDLFAMQRLSLKHVSTALRAARDVDTLAAAARDIRRFARNLLGQGVAARQLTQLVSHLNDMLTEHLVRMLARDAAVDLERACWLAFGSEGRSEQTIATDQDNGLVFVSDEPDRDRPQWLQFAGRVNEALDRCGYPLCKGNVMASNPANCLTQEEWTQRFANWIEHGSPQDLLNASIYFDFRALAGCVELVRPLRELFGGQVSRPPRFMKQMAENALRNRAPLTWLGAIDARVQEGRHLIDLKMNGTAIFVDAARLYALAHGIAETGTRARLEGVARVLEVPSNESQAWVDAFEFLQLLRLRVQLQRDALTGADGLHGGADDANPNLLDVDSLNDLDRRVLKETLRVARRLQQRMELDYMR